MDVRTFICRCGIALSLLLCGCTAVIEPDGVRVAIANVSANVHGNSVTLVAELQADTSFVLDCGFCYGTTKGDMRKVSAPLGNSGEFSLKITHLECGTEYMYKAYVTNGPNTIYSDLYAFVTSDRPLSELELSSYETRLDGSEPLYVSVVVTSNSEWEIIIPEPWVMLQSIDGNLVYFSLEPNKTEYERVCDVVFRTVDKEISVIHKIVQSPTTLASVEIEVSHQGQICYLPIRPKSSKNGYTLMDNWFGFSDSGYRYPYCSFVENNTTEARTGVFYVWYDSSEMYYIKVIQHSYLDVVEFVDPAVKEMCVGLWDTNWDGEITFDELATVQGLEKGQFSGCAITSFDELRFFNLDAFYVLPDYLFEGSSLESVSLPVSSLLGPTGKGIFKDCRNLKKVDLGGRTISDEAFMNCSSLKEMEAVIEGERAFMGCTSLETVLQISASVPEMAFKGCVSLRNVTLDEQSSVVSATIGAEAFHGCSSLSDIRLHRKMSSIGDRAFYGCSGLSAVYISSSTPPTLGEDVFAGTGSDFRIRVPSSLVKVYQTYWPDYADIIEAE